MLPFGHLAVGYIAYTMWTRVADGSPPTESATLLLALGTQFPDLVDKPLHLWFGLYQGRAIGHSLLTLLPFCLVVTVVAHRYARSEWGIAFSLGTLTHLPGDAWPAVVDGYSLDRVAYLFWPILPPPAYEADSVGDHLERVTAGLAELQSVSPGGLVENVLAVELLLVIGVLVVWALDGFPGPALVWRTVSGSR